MSQSKLDSRLTKTIKRRTAKSPVGSTAADTLLHLAKNIEKPDNDFNLVTIQPIITKPLNSELLKKKLKRTQSAEYLKILSEKNLNIKKLKDDNHNLSIQLTEMWVLIKKYQKLRNKLKEKNKIIENLRISIEKYNSRRQSIDKEDPIWSRKSSVSCKKVKKIKKRISKLNSRLSLNSDCQHFDIISRPMTAAHKGISAKSSPTKIKKAFTSEAAPNNLSELLNKSKKILKGWKKAYNHKSFKV